LGAGVITGNRKKGEVSPSLQPPLALNLTRNLEQNRISTAKSKKSKRFLGLRHGKILYDSVKIRGEILWFHFILLKTPVFFFPYFDFFDFAVKNFVGQV
jgi:hypothetical protein